MRSSMTPPCSLSIREYWASPRPSLETRLVNRLSSHATTAGTADKKLAHVRDIEHPASVANSPVLLENAPILDGHLPPSKVHNAPPGGEVFFVKRCAAHVMKNSSFRSSSAPGEEGILSTLPLFEQTSSFAGEHSGLSHYEIDRVIENGQFRAVLLCHRCLRANELQLRIAGRPSRTCNRVIPRFTPTTSAA